MIQNSLLYRILCLTTASAAALEEAAAYFHLRNEPVELSGLREDQQKAGRIFLTDDRAAHELIRFFAYAASAKMDPYMQSDRIDMLVEAYNRAPWSGSVDPYRVYALLDLVGETLCLSDTAALLLCPPGWLTFLTAYSLTQGCSVWECSGSLSKLILKQVPANVDIPGWMLCWVLEEPAQDKLARSLLRTFAGDSQGRAGQLLYRLAVHGKLKQTEAVCRALFREGLDAEKLNGLLQGKNRIRVLRYLEDTYGLKNDP